MTSSSKYVKWDNPAVEPPVPDEAAKVTELQSIIQSTQQKNFSQHCRAFTGTHVKTLGVVKGRFSVLPNLAPELQPALISPANAAKEHDVVIRFANEPSFLQDDKEPGPRGMGMKIFDVEGAFLDPSGSQTRSQDLLFNNAPILELGDVNRCLEIFHIRTKLLDA